jgi:hypothetical protein
MLPSKILIAMLACFLLASSVQEARADNAAKEAIQGAAQAQKDEAIQAAQAKVDAATPALNPNDAKEAIQGAAQAQKDEAIQAAQAKVEDKVQALNAGMPMIGLGSVAMGASMVLLF